MDCFCQFRVLSQKYHGLDCLHETFISHGSGGWSLEIKVQVDSMSTEGLRSGLQIADFSLYPHMVERDGQTDRDTNRTFSHVHTCTGTKNIMSTPPSWLKYSVYQYIRNYGYNIGILGEQKYPTHHVDTGELLLTAPFFWSAICPSSDISKYIQSLKKKKKKN